MRSHRCQETVSTLPEVKEGLNSLLRDKSVKRLANMSPSDRWVIQHLKEFQKKMSFGKENEPKAGQANS